MPPTFSWPGLPAAVAATAAVASAACVVEMDTERPASPIGAVTTDCVVPLPDRGAPAALEYPDGTLWIFDDGGAAFVASIDDACAGVVATWPDPVLALTAEEEADDQTRTDGRAWALRPRGGVVAAGVGYLYYDRVLTGPGVEAALDAKGAEAATCDGILFLRRDAPLPIVAHELTHTYHGQRNPTRDFTGAESLSWFIEGLATSVAEPESDGRRARVVAAFNEGAAPTKLEAVWSGNTRYQMAGLLVDYIDQKWGRAKIIELLPAVTQEDALKILGVGEDELLSGFHAWASAGAEND